MSSIKRLQFGFTIIELLITVTVLTILITLVGPSMADFLDRRRITGQAEAIADILQLARSEAIKHSATTIPRQVTITINSTTAPWYVGLSNGTTACSMAGGTCVINDGGVAVTRVVSNTECSTCAMTTPTAVRTIAFNLRGLVSGAVDEPITILSARGRQVANVNQPDWPSLHMLTRRSTDWICSMLSNKRSLRGVSLVELMVGVVVGLLVLIGATKLYLGTSMTSIVTVRTNRLNQDMRAVMDVMVGDIRRSGYSGVNAAGSTNLFTSATTDIRVAPTCILYSYDADWNGGTAAVVDAGTDFSGFRLNGSAIQVLDSTTANDTSVACTSGTLNWQNITDPTVVKVTGLSFDVIGSRCISFDANLYDPNDPNTYVTWTSTSGTTMACNATAVGAPGTYPPASNIFVEIRQVQISITAIHAADATLSRSLSETVLLRNNKIIAP